MRRRAEARGVLFPAVHCLKHNHLRTHGNKLCTSYRAGKANSGVQVGGSALHRDPQAWVIHRNPDKRHHFLTSAFWHGLGWRWDETHATGHGHQWTTGLK